MALVHVVGTSETSSRGVHVCTCMGLHPLQFRQSPRASLDSLVQ